MKHPNNRRLALLCALALGACALLAPYPAHRQPEVPAFSSAVEADNLFLLETVAPTDAPQPTGEASFAIEVLGTADAKPAKRVLIYHTHTYEAYEQSPDEPYRETEKWRTADNEHNVVRVGAELAALLKALGLEVTHDATAFEPPSLSSAYNRSLIMLERRRGAGESYDLYVDLHRDAYVEGQSGDNAVTVGGAEVARLMLLIGKGEGQTTQGFAARPDWESNLAVAQRVTDALNRQSDGLCKSVRVKSGRFNQHIGTGCMLVEVGNNRNTLSQALAAMPYLADAIAQALGGDR